MNTEHMILAILILACIQLAASLAFYGFVLLVMVGYFKFDQGEPRELEE